MKIKKLLTSLFALIIMVPVVFLCAACTGGVSGKLDEQATMNVGTEANYVASTIDEYKATVTSEVAAKILNSYKMSFSVVTKMGTGAEAKVVDDTSMNMIVKYEPSAADANVLEIKEAALQATVNEYDENGAVVNGGLTGVYLPGDGSVYNRIEGKVGGSEVTMKYKSVLPADVTVGDEMEDNNMAWISFEDLSQMLANVDSIQDPNASFSVWKQGNKSTFKVVAEVEGKTATVYVAFDNGEFVGVQMTMTMDYSSMGGPVIDATIAVLPFEGNIQYPSFNGYEALDYDLLDSIMGGM